MCGRDYSECTIINKVRGKTTRPPPALTCSGDISHHVESIVVHRAGERHRDDGAAVLLIEHGEHQAPQVRPGGAVQLHKAPLLVVIGPMAARHLADDHTLRGGRRAGADVLPQRSGRSHLQRLMNLNIYGLKMS